MRTFLVACGVMAATAVQADMLSVAQKQYLFAKYIEQYDKVYSTEDALKRYNIFADNMEKILAHNAKPNVSYTLGMNQYGDMTLEEFTGRTTPSKFDEAMNAFPTSPALDDIPVQKQQVTTTCTQTSVDWRTQKAVTKVKDMGTKCKAGWAFASIGCIESAYALLKFPPSIRTGTMPFSEQQLVDCAANCNSKATPVTAYKFIKSNGGICMEANYPWDNMQHSYCAKSCYKMTTVQSMIELDTKYGNDEEALINAVCGQPVATSLISSSDIQFYKGGIITPDSDCCEGELCDKARIDHYLLIVGFDTAKINGKDVKYYILKDSRGTSYGEDGYIKIQVGRNLCGVALTPSWAFPSV